MAVTNAQLVEQIAELKALFEQKISFESTPDNSDLVLGKLNELEFTFNKVVGMALGDRAEIANRLDSLYNSINELHNRMYALSSAPRAKTVKQRWQEFWAPVMGAK